jgi:hypothetical protein
MSEGWSTVTVVKKGKAKKRKERKVTELEEDKNTFTWLERALYDMLKEEETLSPEQMLKRINDARCVIEDIWAALDNGSLSKYVRRVNRTKWKIKTI